MAKVPSSELSQPELEELLVTYSAMICHDAGADLSALIKAAGGKVEPYWPKMFAKMMEGKDFGEYIKAAGTPGGGGGGGGAAPAAAAGGAGEAKKEEAVV